ncbi:MAG: cytochrome P460 family protein [Gammaproteobacteria bacterium]
MINKALLKIKLLPYLALVFIPTAYSGETSVPPAPNGIEIPQYYKNWRVIGVSHRTDKNSLRVILGNTVAVEAARSGKTNPWPNGTILAKLVWKDREHPQFPAATVPGELVHTEFMVKDSGKYKATQGWGFARWVGMEQKPFGESAEFGKDCLACHAPAKDTDYVFTRPIQLP